MSSSGGSVFLRRWRSLLGFELDKKEGVFVHPI